MPRWSRPSSLPTNTGIALDRKDTVQVRIENGHRGVAVLSLPWVSLPKLVLPDNSLPILPDRLQPDYSPAPDENNRVSQPPAAQRAFHTFAASDRCRRAGDHKYRLCCGPL